MRKFTYKKFLFRARNATLATILIAANIGTSFYPLMTTQVAHADNTGFLSPTTTHTPNDWSVNNVANIQASDDTYITENEGGSQAYSTFNIPAIPVNALITNIEVRIEAKSSDNSGCRLRTSLSWNNGASKTAYRYMDLSNSDNTNILESADTWGRTWSSSDFTNSNFVLEIQDNDPGDNCTGSATTSVDLIQVKVSYTPIVTNPPLPLACGLDIALVMDNSTSISSSEMAQMKGAMTAFTNALSGTPTEFSVTRFAATASVLQPFTDNIAVVNSAINSIPTGGGYTNWEDGLTKAGGTLPNRADNPDLIIFATDGDPTTSNTVGGTDTSQPNAHLAPAITQANAIKANGTRILALGIGMEGGDSLSRLESISGPNDNTGDVLTSDVISTDFASLATDLAEFANQTCGGTITTQKLIDADGDLSTTADQTPAQNWTFDINGGSNPSATQTDSNGYTPAVKVDPANDYSVNETQQAGYSLLTASCTGATNNGALTGYSITGIQVSNSNIVSCKFINTQLRGTITVNKVTMPSGDTSIFDVTASGTGSIAGTSSRTLTTDQPVVYDVSQGTYSITEDLTNTPGWSTTGNTCTNIVVDANNLSQTCTITNTKLARLKIVKDAVPNSGQDFGFTTTGTGLGAFNLDDDADATLANEQQFVDLMPGVYSVTEGLVLDQQGEPLWDLTNLTCFGTSDFTQNSSTLNVTLAAGDDVTCTFTNTQRGSISGTKYEANADESIVGVSGLSGWIINLLLDGKEVDSTETVSGGTFSFTNLVPGAEYTLEEELKSGWTQIYDPIGITLAAGQTVANQNFGNFKNGTISGYKWNDQDGNGLYEDTEPKLSGWTIYIDADKDGLLDTDETSATTDTAGAYNLGDLAPGTYTVCEVQQPGWTQTFPAGDACHTAIIDMSGETETRNFGNQGRGTIQVIKNVDTDGDGNIDAYGETDWTWDINSSGDYATGSSQNVPAGSYTVSEDQKANFHVTYSSCSGEPNSIINTSLSVTVTPGENVVCTFVNTRDTGTIKLVKHVINDNGGTANASNFNLHIKQNGTDITGSPLAGSEQGTDYNLETGTYVVSEEQPVAGYTQTSIICAGQPTDTIILASNAEVNCTITNDDIAPQLTVIKQVINDNSGTSAPADFTMQVTGTNVAPSASFPGNSNGKTVTVNAGSYSLSESGPTGYTASYSTDCSGTIALAETKTCTIINDDIPHPRIRVEKTGPTTAYEGDVVTYTFTVTNTGDIALANVVVNDDLAGIAAYQSGDANDNDLLDLLEEWTFTVSYTVPSPQIADVTNNVTASGTDTLGQAVTGTDSHTLDVLHPAITVVKQVISTPEDDGLFNLHIDSTIHASNVSNKGSTGSVAVAPGSHTIGETAGTNTDLSDYAISYSDNCANGLVTVTGDDHQVCTITNTKLAKLTVVKDANPSGDQSFEFTVRPIDSEYASLASALSEVISAPTDNTFALDDNTDETLSDRKTINQLELGSYAITEEPVDGWDLTDITCDQDSIFERDGSTAIVRLTAGSDITCTFTNTQRGNITILKDAQPDSSQVFKFTANVNEEPEAFSLVDDGQDPALATRQFSDLRPGVYEFSEEAIEGWSLSDISCSNSNQDDVRTTANSVSVNLQPGDNIICTFTNTRDTGTITVTKKLTPATDTGKFNLLINGTVYAANIGNGGATDAVTVPTGVHTVSESAGLGTILEGYETTYVCMDNDSIITSGTGTTITALALAKGQNITCTFTNNIGEVLSVVTPPASAPELADTGSAIILALAAGTLLVTTTGVLALATRRYADQ